MLGSMSWDALKKRIEDAAVDLAVLKIQTSVVKPPEVAGGASAVVVDITTTIEQITGDIENVLTESAFTLDYGEHLRAFHEQQRADGLAILQRNVAVIRELLQLVKDATNGNLGGGGGTPPPTPPPTPTP